MFRSRHESSIFYKWILNTKHWRRIKYLISSQRVPCGTIKFYYRVDLPMNLNCWERQLFFCKEKLKNERRRIEVTSCRLQVAGIKPNLQKNYFMVAFGSWGCKFQVAGIILKVDEPYLIVPYSEFSSCRDHTEGRRTLL